MNPLSVFNIFKSANNIAKTFVGSRQDRDQHIHNEAMGVQGTYAAEFNHRANRTWWDSIIDGLNRLPRPMFVSFIMYFFILAVKDPLEFMELCRALAIVPQPMWYALSGVLAFYFGSRHFQRMGEMKMSLRTMSAPAPVAQEVPKTKSRLPKWYKIAMAEMNSVVKEIKGEKDNPQIIEYHKATSLKATSDETAWCSAFVNWCMLMAGEARTNKANARSWLDYGKVLDAPVPGCVVIFKRGSEPWMGHVGFYAGEEGGHIRCLGGNQNNQISIASYAKSRVLGYRWPE